jgi:hypothetical protein
MLLGERVDVSACMASEANLLVVEDEPVVAR